MRIKAIVCEGCGDTVYSRTEEDWRECNCGAVSTTGGQAYTKYEMHEKTSYKKVIINVDTSAEILYNDWKDMLDVYGLIRGQRPPERHARRAH